MWLFLLFKLLKMSNKLGLTHVYTGDGKGKTTHAIGIAMRAAGQGFKVNIVQFMKGGAYTGEFITAKNFLPNVEFEQFGKACIKEQKQLKLLNLEENKPQYFDYVREDIDCGPCRSCFVNDKEQRDYVCAAFEEAKKVTVSGDYDLVVLDEINMAVKFGFLKVNEVLKLIKNKFENTELILTGRGAPEELIMVAYYASEIKLIKHPFDKGVSARRGIEY